ncbi:uncharacterized protein LOC121248322 isoform X4 [Juglans microcarpa x Juglans regia]|uniref:uncharacterized protein LOC121248322 isoform X4 n=1 Tax=Juglans microcarpa x Juglans regia TaxID=2249226 RepID=UPI001B7E9805|nr:uncharacterized protein LOC121248322 isoform X4 [Juglans microcarpa x Juglans regia]
METLKSSFPIFTTNPFCLSKKPLKPSKVSIKPPPPDFDFRTEILDDSRTIIAQTYPELLDLADTGSLVLIEKRRYGPVPAWRTEFVEPEKIWLVGTTHISQESVEDVERVVRAVKPDNVVVELCRSRAGIMYTSNDGAAVQKLRSNMFSLSGNEFFGAVGRSINLGGQTALALRLLLAVFSSKISSDINRPFGGEFRAARKVSEEIGAQIVLGDRPIEITLERAWNSLTWTEKLSLVTSVIRGITSSSDMSRNGLKYLAWSLKRSKAVNNSKRVVGVIGKGHMNGVIYALVSDQGNLRFRDLAGGKRPDGDNHGSNRWVDGLLKSLARDTVIGILLWALYEQIKGGA